MFAIFKEADSREVEIQLDRMLADCSRMFDMAVGAIFGDHSAQSVSEEIWDLDKGVNRAERAIRRELLVRGAVRGGEIEQGLLLAYMSVAKDVERIGDYCKNIWDLANIGVNFGADADAGIIRGHTDEVRGLLDRGREAFSSQDDRAVHGLIPELEMNAACHDELVFGLARSTAPGSEAVPRALYYRFLKRIVSHLGNVLTSVVMPLDRIDYYKESKAASTE